MQKPHYVIFYVNSPVISRDFYANLLTLTPTESSANFVLFTLDSGIQLGLWAKDDVEPSTSLTGGGAELCIAMNDKKAVDSLYTHLQQQGIPIAQSPTTMDFGYTFTLLDPDSHRVRFFAAK